MPIAVIWLCSLLIVLCSIAGNCNSAQQVSSKLQKLDLPCSREDTGVQGKLVRREISNKILIYSVDLTQLNEVKNSEKGERERREEDYDISGTGSVVIPEIDPLKNQSSYTTSVPGVLSLTVDTLISVILLETSEDCSGGWQEMLATGDGRESENEGLKALDSFGKVGAGYFQGNAYALGSYDGCHSLPTMQYCLSELEVFDSQQQRNLALLHGSCLPQTCSQEDIRLAVNLTSSKLNLLVNVGDVSCEGESKAHYNAGSIIILIVWCVFAVIVSVATAGQFVYRKMTKYQPTAKDAETAKPLSKLERKRCSLSETIRKYLFCFSLYKTVSQIFAIKHQPSSAITCLHGLRVISMCWIILGHLSLFAYFFSENPSYISNSASHISYRGITESELAVDSFFLMSGLLVTYHTLRKMENRKGKFKFPAFLYYIHRFLRLTPVYAFILFSYWFLTVHLADGPVWQKTIGENSHFYNSCKQYWWTNFLYINNIYPRKHLDICMPWSWYLTSDMQFYVIAPLIIVPLSLNYKVGLTLIGILLTANVVIIGSIAGGYGLSANSAKFEELTLALQDRENYHNLTDDIYTKPWTRIGPYLIGILIGYFLHKQQKKPIFKKKRSNYIFYSCLWVIAVALCASTVYGPQKRYDGKDFSKSEDLMYLMFGRLAWAVSVAIIIFVCHNGYGWIVNSILSLKIWTPLSRLTFMTYLVHGVVLYILLYTGRRPFFGDSVNQALYFITAVVLSFSAAAILSSFVEFPLSNVEEFSFKLAGFKERDSTRRSTFREREWVVEQNIHVEDEDGHGREREDEVTEGGGEGVTEGGCDDVRGGQSEDVIEERVKRV